MHSLISMRAGDIFLGEGNVNISYPQNGHPIVFLRKNDQYTFIGLMLSTKSYKGMNNQMEVMHFEVYDENGEEYEFKYNNTHVVPLNLLKKSEWEPFVKIGQLNKEGLLYVKEVVTGTEPAYWEDVIQSND